MLSTRTLIILAIGLTLWFAGCSDPVEDESQETKASDPLLANAEKLTYDAGDVLPNAKIQHDFEIENQSSAPLQITKVESSCTCNSTTEPGDEIPPGETMKVATSFNVGRGSGTATQFLVLHTDDPNRSRIACVVNYNVLPSLSVFPDEIAFGDVVAGVATNRELRVWVDPGVASHSVEVTSAESTFPKLMCQLSRAKRSEESDYGSRGWRASVTGKFQPPFGERSGILRLHTTLPERPTIDVPIKVNVVPALLAAPSAIVWGNVADDQQLSQEIEIRSRVDGDFHVESVESSDSDIVVTILDHDEQPGLVARIRIERDLTAHLSSGVSERTVTVHTTDADCPTLSIPVMWLSTATGGNVD